MASEHTPELMMERVDLTPGIQRTLRRIDSRPNQSPQVAAAVKQAAMPGPLFIVMIGLVELGSLERRVSYGDRSVVAVATEGEWWVGQTPPDKTFGSFASREVFNESGVHYPAVAVPMGTHAVRGFIGLYRPKPDFLIAIPTVSMGNDGRAWATSYATGATPGDVTRLAEAGGHVIPIIHVQS